VFDAQLIGTQVLPEPPTLFSFLFIAVNLYDIPGMSAMPAQSHIPIEFYAYLNDFVVV